MGRVVFIDGVEHTPEQARVSVYDRAFLYGDSVFETVRTYGGKLYALDEHMDRLARSASLMGMELPVTSAQIADETARAVAAAANPESYARVMLTRGSGPVGLDTALAVEPLRVVIVEPLSMPAVEKYQRGLDAVSVQTVRASDAAHSAKLGNYVASALALREAHAQGAAEALIVDRDGLVVEGTTSNVFMVQGGELLTPPLDIGVLEGITRARVLALADAQNLQVRYVALPPREVARSDELFLTSSVREIMPVVKLDGHPIGAGVPGPVTRALHRGFRALVGLADHLPWEPSP